MWKPATEKVLKVRLTSNGEDVETTWAEDLGAAGDGRRRVRIANVPFLHAKPTFGDVIVVTRAADGFPTWDRGGVPYEEIGARIEEDGGRFAMVIDYELHEGTTDVAAAVHALDAVAERADMLLEGCFSPKRGKAGRAYVAVRYALSVDEAMRILRDPSVPLTLTLVHPRS